MISDLPESLAHLRNAAWTELTIGQSEAEVWRIEKPDRALILKTGPVHGLSEMRAEADRLAWLGHTGLPAPELVDFFAVSDRHYLLMTALPGRDLTECDNVVSVLAEALNRLRDIDVSTCPFDHSLDRRLAHGEANVRAGLVDESDFDDERLGWTAHQVLDWLHANRPARENLVVTHGDASLPNFMAQDGQFTGYIDCGRFGVADRWQDLAIACRSLEFNEGGAVEDLLAACGVEWDEERYRYYCALDDLF